MSVSACGCLVQSKFVKKDDVSKRIDIRLYDEDKEPKYLFKTPIPFMRLPIGSKWLQIGNSFEPSLIKNPQ